MGPFKPRGQPFWEVKPLYQQLSLLLPEVEKSVEQLKETEEHWKRKKEATRWKPRF